MMYLLLSKSRQNGMMSLEKDIEDPHNSTIFSAYPRLMADSVLMNFVIDYLRLMLSGNMSAFEIESLMDEEIETCEHEHEVPANSLNSVGDALPAFGIVAAVMGVVNALASADRPAAELGELIAHAMVGTFLGILLAYGFILPLASLLRQKAVSKSRCSSVLRSHCSLVLMDMLRRSLSSSVAKHCSQPSVRVSMSLRSTSVRLNLLPSATTIPRRTALHE